MPSRQILQSIARANTPENRENHLFRPRVLLVDDSDEILDYSEKMLRAECEIIGKISNGNSVCPEVERLNPDLVVLDISIGDCSGINIALELQRSGFAGQIVFLTVHEDLDFVNAAVGAGGRGYVVKSRMGIELKAAIDAVLANHIFISSSLQQG